MKRGWLWAVVIFSLAGVVGSLLATHQYFQIAKSGFEEKSFCAINEFINCDVAYASSYAKLFGIPVSWLGFVFYLWMLALTFWILFKKTAEQELASFAWLLSLGGIGMSIYKATVAFFVLKVLCLICASMYIVNIALFLSWHAFLKIGVLNWVNLSLKPKFISLVVSTVAVFAIGWGAMAAYHSHVLKDSQLDVPLDEIVLFHFRQSQYQFEVDPKIPVWGNPNAKVTVVEFSDFQCPYCRHAAFHLKPVLSEFKDKVRFYFYHFPLDQSCNDNIKTPMHDKACLAAEAAICAGKMGDFWNFHDDIFRDQKNLSPEMLLNLAKKRGWDEEKFKTCMEAPDTLATIKENIAAGNKIYITGTPTVLVGNRRVKYWTNPEVFRAIIEEEIKR